MQENEKDLVTVCFRYWARPTLPRLLRGENGGSRKPEYLKRSLVDDVIEVVFTPYDPSELTLTIIPPSDRGAQDVKELVLEYRGNEEYPTKVHATLEDTLEQPWRQYQLTVTATMRALQQATYRIEDALRKGKLKGFGRAVQLPMEESFGKPGEPISDTHYLNQQ